MADQENDTETIDDVVDGGDAGDTVDAADSTATDTDTAGAADGTAGNQDDGTGEVGDSGTEETADGVTPAPSEAEQRKLPTKATAGQQTTSQHQTTRTGPAPKPAPTPQDAFNNETAQWGRERAKFQQEQQQLAERVKQFEQGDQQRKAEAERLALKPWHAQHPDSAKTMAKVGKVKAYFSALNAIPAEQQTPELKGNLARSMGVTPEDAKVHDEFEQHREETINRMAADPEGFMDQRMSSLVPRMIQDAFNQYFAYQRAESDVKQRMADPAKIAPHAEFIKERLSGGSPFKDVMEIVDLKNRIAELEGKGSAAAGKDAKVTQREKAATERERLSKGAAAITRDPRTGGKPDFYSMALKESNAHPGDKGWQPGGNKFNRHLAGLEESHRNAADQGEP